MKMGYLGQKKKPWFLVFYKSEVSIIIKSDQIDRANALVTQELAQGMFAFKLSR
jgi:hypothetical protein